MLQWEGSARQGLDGKSVNMGDPYSRPSQDEINTHDDGKDQRRVNPARGKWSTKLHDLGSLNPSPPLHRPRTQLRGWSCRANCHCFQKQIGKRSGWARPHLRVGHSCNTRPSTKAPWQILPHIWPDVWSQVGALNRCILGYPQRVCEGSYKADHQQCAGSCISSSEGKMAMDGGRPSSICKE